LNAQTLMAKYRGCQRLPRKIEVQSYLECKSLRRIGLIADSVFIAGNGFSRIALRDSWTKSDLAHGRDDRRARAHRACSRVA
jgi:hypothetical protein